jgi:hypothetical protein
MLNDEFEKISKKDLNENLKKEKYGPEIKYETYLEFYCRKFKRDFVYCKVKI